LSEIDERETEEERGGPAPFGPRRPKHWPAGIPYKEER